MKCTRCRQTKALDEFSGNREKTYKCCRACREKSAKWRAANPQYDVNWRAAHPEAHREWCIANKEKRKSYFKEYVVANKDKIRDYRYANRDKTREYVISHWPNFMVYAGRKADRKSNRLPFDMATFITPDGILDMWDAQQHRCWYCNVVMQTENRRLCDGCTIERLDNSIGHTSDNCVLACHECNVRKKHIQKMKYDPVRDVRETVQQVLHELIDQVLDI